MPAVGTARGTIDVAGLGRTLMHEHIFVLGTENVENHGSGDWWDEEEKIADAVAKLELDIIVATGIYPYNDIPFQFSDDVLPALRAAGVADAQIDQMLVGNPRRYFTR